MARNADETRRKILHAATEEFAAYGIAGARVDRVTKNAGVNNALLYRYFGSKAELFDTVYGHLVEQTVDDVPLDVTDLPGYVGRLFDHYAARPQLTRLTAWRELERPEAPLPQAVEEATEVKLELITAAQKEGSVSDRYTPEELLGLLTHLSLADTPLVTKAIWPTDREQARATVVRAARDLLAG
jgi:AcrR family transcriptional regulator